MAMVDVIRADEMSRLGLCADEDCDGVDPRPLAQPVTTLLQHHLRQPQLGRCLPGPASVEHDRVRFLGPWSRGPVHPVPLGLGHQRLDTADPALPATVRQDRAITDAGRAHLG